MHYLLECHDQQQQAVLHLHYFTPREKPSDVTKTYIDFVFYNQTSASDYNGALAYI